METEQLRYAKSLYLHWREHLRYASGLYLYWHELLRDAKSLYSSLPEYKSEFMTTKRVRKCIADSPYIVSPMARHQLAPRLRSTNALSSVQSQPGSCSLSTLSTLQLRHASADRVHADCHGELVFSKHPLDSKEESIKRSQMGAQSEPVRPARFEELPNYRAERVVFKPVLNRRGAPENTRRNRDTIHCSHPS